MSTEAIQVRLESHDKRLAGLERTLETTQPAVLAVEVRQLRAELQGIRGELHELRNDVKASTRSTWALAVSLLVGVLSIAVTASQIAGG